MRCAMAGMTNLRRNRRKLARSTTVSWSEPGSPVCRPDYSSPDKPVRREMLALHGEQAVRAPLVYDYPGDAVSRQLDSMTLEDYLIRTFGVSRETIRLLVAGESSGGFGLGPDALSAFLHYEWSKVIPTVDDSMATGIQMFPGGN